jgi:tripartite-type tricarboxylate transporter receptor subunit TctC
MRSLLGGEVQLMFSSTGTSMPHVKSGKVRGLAVSTLEPSALAPGLPTMTASGIPGYEYIGFDGLFAPAKTPTAIINQLNRETVRFLSITEVKEKLLNIGQEVVASSPEDLGNQMKSEVAKLSKLMRDLGLIKPK